MNLRPATWNDRHLLYEWRKADEAESWWQGDVLRPLDHGRWLQARLDSPLVDLWIARDGGTPIGQARCDSNGEISFSLGSEWRGKGLGSELVRAVVTRSSWPRLKACVDRENTTSIAAMEAAGFARREDVLFMRWPR